MKRSRSWILIAVLFGLALLFVAWDVMDYAADTQPFKMAPLGTRWAAVNRDSLLLLQPAIERHVAVWLWSAIQWVLVWPAWSVPVPAALGILGLLIKAIRRRR
jgi:hypothetical protein